MFADDTNITFAASTLSDLENGLNSELRSLNIWLISNKLSLNVAKTEFMVIGSNQRLNSFSDNQVNVEIDAKLITKVKEAKLLGVIIDEHLSWSNHIGDLSKKISSAIGALKRIRPYISKRTALQIYQALILPHFDYCSSVWGDCNLTLGNKLQKLPNRAARAITRSNYDTSATFYLTTRRQKLKAILIFKTSNGLTPAYLQNSFSTRSTQYNLRNVESKLELPLLRTNYGKRAFCYSGALLWNSLPISLRQSDSLEYFKREID